MSGNWTISNWWCKIISNTQTSTEALAHSYTKANTHIYKAHQGSQDKKSWIKKLLSRHWWKDITLRRLKVVQGERKSQHSSVQGPVGLQKIDECDTTSVNITASLGEHMICLISLVAKERRQQLATHLWSYEHLHQLKTGDTKWEN